jgi:hypothetical protein
MFRYLRLTLVPLVAVYGASDYFQMKIIDQQTGRGVPLVRLTTNNHIVCYTDSNGIVAWNEPGLMEQEVYFSIDRRFE